MNLTIQRETLLKPLQILSSIVDRKQTQPILSHVLLVAKDNQLHLTGTDLEIVSIGMVPLVSLTEAGETTVSVKKLFDICRALPEKAIITLVLNNDTIQLRANDSFFNLKTLPVNLFPALEEHAYATHCTIKAGLLKQLFSKTYFAMGQQDARQYLNGALLHIYPDKIQCVAMDGHRLAWSSLVATGLSNNETRIIIPRKSVLELMRLLEDESSVITLSLSDHRMKLVADNFVFISKLMHARYPDYHRLIPKGEQSVCLDRETMRQALLRVAILSNEQYRGVHLQLENKKLFISAHNAEQEQAHENIPLEYTGDKIEISFNVAYLLDAISALTTRIIRFVFTDLNHGVRIQPEVEDNDIYVVMPMRL